MNPIHCVTIEAAHNGTGPSPIILVNNVCGAALNAANGQWAQFNTTPGQIPDDATEVRLIARLTSSAINERLGLDNLRIFGNVVQTAPTVSGIGLILLTLAMLVGGIFGVRRRFSPSHS